MIEYELYTVGSERFGISGSVGSQKYLCKFERLSPVRTTVSRHLRQAAATPLYASGGQRSGKLIMKYERRMKN